MRLAKRLLSTGVNFARVPMTAETRRQRFVGLDLLRFTFALLVAIYHLGIPEVQPILFGNTIFGFVFRNGWYGVELFFLLSGFVISNSLRDRSWLEFLVARLIRLYPAMFICLALTVAIGWARHTGYPYPIPSYVSSLLLAYDYFGVKPASNVLWTLIVEVKFYLIVVLFIFVVNPVRRTAMAIGTSTALWIASGALIGILFPGSLVTNLLRLDGFAPIFALGIVLNLLVTGNLTRLERSCAYGLVIAVAPLAAIDHRGPWQLLILLALAFSVILFSSRTTTKYSSRVRRFAYLLGGLSFPLYLIHLEVGEAIMSVVGKAFGENSYVSLAISIMFLCVISSLINILVEQRIQRVFQRFARRKLPIRSN